MVVTECTGDEKIPEVVVAEFDFGTEPDVACEQSQNRGLGKLDQCLNKIADARADFAFVLVEHLIQQKNIVSEELFEFRFAGLHLPGVEKFADQGAVGAARKLHLTGGVGDPENEVEHPFKGFYPGTSGTNQGAVYVE